MTQRQCIGNPRVC